MRPPQLCIDCGFVRKPQARHLCATCYDKRRRNGTLIDRPRKYMSAEEFLEEFELLRGEGYTRAQIAERLGVTRDAVDKRLSRMKKSDTNQGVAA